jgi:hypothetical protein
MSGRRRSNGRHPWSPFRQVQATFTGTPSSVGDEKTHLDDLFDA